MGEMCLKKAAALLLVWTLVIHQISASPVVSVGGSLPMVQSQVQVRTVKSLRRTARMTPLWRILNSKPFGAYCQNNYECSTGLCRGGFCAMMHRTATD
ncbi:liver-expressed antimicrobial peptide 2 isoform X3 [Eucyclogobius newberryi]|uniref:liver-expressed antimicrobial peptide 2 isoform X3 n=1 Tax=Eucyclogobius newberryi TaxID=166745 RepID=UPI003B5A4745